MATKRTYNAILARRNARARGLGWLSYGQQRRWEKELNPSTAEGRKRAMALGQRIAPSAYSPWKGRRPKGLQWEWQRERPNSLWPEEVNLVVNPSPFGTHTTTQGYRTPPSWQLRLLLASTPAFALRWQAGQ